MELARPICRHASPVVGACINPPIVIGGPPYPAFIQIRHGEIARVGAENIAPYRYGALFGPRQRSPATFTGMLLEFPVWTKMAPLSNDCAVYSDTPENCSPFSLATSRSRPSIHATITLPSPSVASESKRWLVIRPSSFNVRVGKRFDLNQPTARNEHCPHISVARIAPRSAARCHRAQPRFSAGSRHPPRYFPARG